MLPVVQMLETDDKEQLTQCAALLRSAWEDCNHNQRCLLAEKERVKLDKRPDNTRATPLSKGDERSANYLFTASYFICTLKTLPLRGSWRGLFISFYGIYHFNSFASAGEFSAYRIDRSSIKTKNSRKITGCFWF